MRPLAASGRWGRDTPWSIGERTGTLRERCPCGGEQARRRGIIRVWLTCSGTALWLGQWVAGCTRIRASLEIFLPVGLDKASVQPRVASMPEVRLHVQAVAASPGYAPQAAFGVGGEGSDGASSCSPAGNPGGAHRATNATAGPLSFFSVCRLRRRIAGHWRRTARPWRIAEKWVVVVEHLRAG